MFEVTDTGCGVVKEGLQSLFRDYVQASMLLQHACDALSMHKLAQGPPFLACLFLPACMHALHTCKHVLSPWPLGLFQACTQGGHQEGRGRFDSYYRRPTEAQVACPTYRARRRRCGARAARAAPAWA